MMGLVSRSRACTVGNERRFDPYPASDNGAEDERESNAAEQNRTLAAFGVSSDEAETETEGAAD